MRMTIILILTPTLALAVTACGSSSPRKQGVKHVVAAFYPLAFAAEEIGGPRLDVQNLTPAGAEPHDLEIAPKQVQEVRSADLVLLLGHGVQPQVEDAAGSRPNVLHLLDTPGLHRLPNGVPHVGLVPHRS